MRCGVRRYGATHCVVYVDTTRVLLSITRRDAEIGLEDADPVLNRVEWARPLVRPLSRGHVLERSSFHQNRRLLRIRLGGRRRFSSLESDGKARVVPERISRRERYV